MMCGRNRMDEFCVLCLREDISDCCEEELIKTTQGEKKYE